MGEWECTDTEYVGRWEHWSHHLRIATTYTFEVAAVNGAGTGEYRNSIQDSHSQAAGGQKCYIPTNTNLVYGCEDFGHNEFAMSSRPSGATMATQDSIYETTQIYT